MVQDQQKGMFLFAKNTKKEKSNTQTKKRNFLSPSTFAPAVDASDMTGLCVVIDMQIKKERDQALQGFNLLKKKSFPRLHQKQGT